MTLRRLLRDTRAVAMIEFAMVFPVLLATGCYGVELANFALANLRVSQYALTLADNASRVGLMSNLAVQQLREGDLNDVLRGTYLSGQGMNLTTYGRVTLSSLEYETIKGTPTQMIHWQRCVGLMGKGLTGNANTWDSSYGTTDPKDGTNSGADHPGTPAPNGMGDAGYTVNANPNDTQGGVMFVEINYQYQPLFGSFLMSPRRIHYTGSFFIRNTRDTTQVYNPSPAVTPSTCDRYYAAVPTS